MGSRPSLVPDRESPIPCQPRKRPLHHPPMPSQPLAGLDPHARDATLERTELIRNLAEAFSLWVQLNETIDEVERGIVSLQYMIDPEKN